VGDAGREEVPVVLGNFFGVMHHPASTLLTIFCARHPFHLVLYSFKKCWRRVPTCCDSRAPNILACIALCNKNRWIL
jgi:hypothetical protein